MGRKKEKIVAMNSAASYSLSLYLFQFSPSLRISMFFLRRGLIVSAATINFHALSSNVKNDVYNT